MASLFIKDSETAGLATELARRMGKTKTAVVREALQRYLQGLESKPEGKRDIVAWMADFRRRNPLGPPTGLKADKAFYDSLYEDDESA